MDGLLNAFQHLGQANPEPGILDNVSNFMDSNWHLLRLAAVTFAVLYVSYIIKLFGFSWRKEPFEGIAINVREPRNGWIPQDFKFEAGPNVFFALFSSHISAWLAGVEANMGLCVTHHEGAGVMGMITQEMNHAMLQSVVNVACEKSEWKYPALAWQRFYTTKVIRRMPSWLLRGCAACAEALFISISSPGGREAILDLLPEPKSLIIMHLMEEAEHTWSSIPELADDLNIFQRLAGFCFFWVHWLGFVLPVCMCEAFWYFRKEIFLQGRILDIFPMLKVNGVWVINVFICVTCQVIFRMDPSDEAYYEHMEWCKSVYAPYEHLFRISHRQKPDAGAELARRKSFAVNGDPTKRMSVYLYAKQKRMSIHQPEAMKLAEDETPSFNEEPRVLALRTVAYEVAKLNLQNIGLGNQQISDLFMEDPQLLDTMETKDLEQSATPPPADEQDAAAGNKLPVFTREDVVRACQDPEKVWIIIRDMVVDVSEFQHKHPGGMMALHCFKGKDATKPFLLIHDQRTVKFSEYIIGRLAKPGTVAQ